MSTAGPSRMAKQTEIRPQQRCEDEQPLLAKTSRLRAFVALRATRDQGNRSQIARAVLLLACALLLGGCMLMSGGRTSSDTLPDGGNVSGSFVGADGQQEQTVDTGAARTTFSTIAIVQAERGELQIELLNADGSVAYAVKGRPDEAVTRSGSVTTDENGQLRYRLSATGARNGSFQLLYQRPNQ